MRVHGGFGIDLFFESDKEAGVELYDRADYGQAEGFLRKALQGTPSDADLLWRIASILSFRGETVPAVALAEYALGIDPACHQACATLCACALIDGDIRRAEGYADRCLDIAPNMPSVMWNKAHCELYRGDYKNGFERWKWGRAAKLRWQRSVLPEWDGSKVQSLLVWCEQGHGDTFQFARYLKQLEGRADFVIAEVYRESLHLFKSQGWDCHFVGQQPDASCCYPYDAHISLLDLPSLLGVASPEDVDGKPYLKPAPSVSAEGTTQGRKVGIVWQGATRHNNDQNRSIPKDALAPLLEFPLVSLQRRVECPEQWLDFGVGLKDYSQTAAALAELDLLITVDTSVAHLAGALGVETWMVAPLNGDWRWGLEGSKSCWYDSVKIIRPQSMEQAVKDIARDLRKQTLKQA